ncbi:MAG: putative Ig domain-containing protein, partial [Candidatus Omnitrophota bacterium]
MRRCIAVAAVFFFLFSFTAFALAANLIPNPGMESGSSGWWSYVSSASNKAAYATDNSHSRTHALKITNAVAGYSYWSGSTVNLPSPYPKTITLSGWAKAQSVSANSLVTLYYAITFQDGTSQWYYTDTILPHGTYDWRNKQVSKTFAKAVKSVTPYMLFYYGTGTVWFDDMGLSAGTAAEGEAGPTLTLTTIGTRTPVAGTPLNFTASAAYTGTKTLSYAIYPGGDTNYDKALTPVDVLSIITVLNTYNSVSRGSAGWNPLMDLNHDNNITPIDCLMAINSINRGTTSLPTGTSINPTTGAFTWTPTQTYFGENLVTVVVTDGTLMDSETVTIMVGADILPPSGTISINNNNAYTNQAAVTLTLAATDPGSGLSQMQFSNNNSTWSAPEPYAATKSWTLSSGDGSKSVWVKFKDGAGNWSAPISSPSIILDTTPPA